MEEEAEVGDDFNDVAASKRTSFLMWRMFRRSSSSKMENEARTVSSSVRPKSLNSYVYRPILDGVGTVRAWGEGGKDHVITSNM